MLSTPEGAFNNHRLLDVMIGTGCHHGAKRLLLVFGALRLLLLRNKLRNILRYDHRRFAS
jgi:hypothetical protein